MARERAGCVYVTKGIRCRGLITHRWNHRYFEQVFVEPLCTEHAQPKYHPPDVVKDIEAVPTNPTPEEGK